jgi:hypothetical protein
VSVDYAALAAKLFEDNGLALHPGNTVYPGVPTYMWFEKGDHFIRVRHMDGAEVLYPISAFDYAIVKRAGE